MSNTLTIDRMVDRLVERQLETEEPLLTHPRLAGALRDSLEKLTAVRDMEIYRLVEAKRHIRMIMRIWPLTETQIGDIHKAVKKKLKEEKKRQR